MTEWANGYVEANGIKIFYHRTGAGSNKPPILLLHGFTDNGLCWSPVARDLEETYDVIMTDARGHGRTEGPIGQFSINLLGDDAAAVIRGLGLDKPFLFGHSMGAVTAEAVVAKYPDLVRAAILEDPPFFIPKDSTPEELQKLQANDHQNLAFQKLPLEERIATGRTHNPNWSEEEIIPWAASKGEYSPDIMQHRAAFRVFPWRDLLSQISRPILLITGDTARGALVAPEVAREVAALCMSCEVANISGAGHCIHRDRYNETMQAVWDFLRNHQA